MFHRTAIPMTMAKHQAIDVMHRHQSLRTSQAEYLLELEMDRRGHSSILR